MYIGIYMHEENILAKARLPEYKFDIREWSNNVLPFY
jgi:hypothetical protein